LPADLQAVNEKTFPQQFTLAIVGKLFKPDKGLPLTIRTYHTVSGQCGSGGMTFLSYFVKKEVCGSAPGVGFKTFPYFVYLRGQHAHKQQVGGTCIHDVSKQETMVSEMSVEKALKIITINTLLTLVLLFVTIKL
jgi:hypothetical protein